jgi:hypothetical protein
MQGQIFPILVSMANELFRADTKGELLMPAITEDLAVLGMLRYIWGESQAQVTAHTAIA